MHECAVADFDFSSGHANHLLQTLERKACILALSEAPRIHPELRMMSLEDPAFEAIFGSEV